MLPPLNHLQFSTKNGSIQFKAKNLNADPGGIDFLMLVKPKLIWQIAWFS